MSADAEAGPEGGTTAVCVMPRSGEAAPDRWMRADVPDQAGRLPIERSKVCQADPTDEPATPGRSHRLDRKPSGPPSGGAHAVKRETRVMSAAGVAGFPVAHVYGRSQDDEVASVASVAFFASVMVEERILWSVAFDDVSKDQRAACPDALNAAIARPHGIDPRAAALGDRDGMPDRSFCIARNAFPLKATLRGIEGRVVRGAAASAPGREQAGSSSRLAGLAGQAAKACH